MRVFLYMLFFLLLSCSEKSAENTSPNEPATMLNQSEITYVTVAELIPDAILDVRYATENNFTGEAVYDSATVYLVEEAAIALSKAAESLRKKGYRLVLFDGYRPLEVQKKFWEVYPDPQYVADPANGSRHNRGAAIDLSLADKDGKPLTMPTDFDYFGEEAHHDYMQLSDEQIRNRSILREAMEAHGFQKLDSEWWHYDLVGWEKYPILRP